MRNKYTFLIFLMSIATMVRVQAQSAESRKIESFDKSWMFFKGDPSGADKVSFSDAAWRKLDVPHDWMIEGPYAESNPTGRGGGYLPADIGWYRKHFEVSDADAKKKVSIEFDGVMANSDVWINGYHLGKRPYGYISFEYEMTGHLNFGKGKTNVLSVRADNAIQPASRYYTGAGIYRHVHLTITDPLHIAINGVFITTPQIAPGKNVVLIKTTVVNDGKEKRSFRLQGGLDKVGGQADEHIVSAYPDAGK